jgi:hypothetical protein
LDNIREACQVWIDTSMAKSAQRLSIYSERKTNVKQAVAEIRQLVLRPPSLYATLFLVQPSPRQFNVEVSFREVTRGFELIYNSSPTTLTTAGQDILSAEKQFKTDFRQGFARIAEQMKCDSNEMRMRLHFGRVGLTKKKKGQVLLKGDDIETVLQAANNRGFTFLDQKIGGDDFARVLVQEALSRDIFQPPSSNIGDVTGCKPRHVLILFYGHLRVEFELQLLHVTSRKEKEEGKAEYTLGQMRAFRRVGGDDEHDIVAACPGRPFDWKLEVQSETPFGDLSQSLHQLRLQITIVDSKDGRGEVYPMPSLPRGHLKGSGIEEIATKTVWTFECIHSPYYLEVVLIRKFDRESLSAPSENSCAVTIYGVNWDDETRRRNVALQPREFGDNFEAFFEAFSGQDGFEVFLEDIGKLQAFVGSVRDALAAGTAQT